MFIPILTETKACFYPYLTETKAHVYPYFNRNKSSCLSLFSYSIILSLFLKVNEQFLEEASDVFTSLQMDIHRL